jgi:hypothetical protein
MKLAERHQPLGKVVFGLIFFAVAIWGMLSSGDDLMQPGRRGVPMWVLSAACIGFGVWFIYLGLRQGRRQG